MRSSTMVTNLETSYLRQDLKDSGKVLKLIIGFVYSRRLLSRIVSQRRLDLLIWDNSSLELKSKLS